MKTIIFNGKVALPDSVMDNGYVAVEDGLISEIGSGDPDAGDCETIDAGGGWIAPGLVDIHIHGCGGHWSFFSAGDILKMCGALASHGVTSFLPTTVSLPRAQILNSIAEIRKAMAQWTPECGARIAGIHLEGPFINSKRPGAHLPPAIRNSADDEINEILEAAGDALRIVTLAPEADGGMKLVRTLAARGIVPSIGHSDATSEQTLEAIGAGARHFTHIFNAARQFHQREPGCAFAALVNPELTAEIILDFRHVHRDAAIMAVRTKGADKMALVSDSIIAAGLGDGDYDVWGFKVTVKDGVAALPDGTMAGSVTTLNRSVANAMTLPGISQHEAFRMATHVPAKIIGMENSRGALVAGRVADIAVFDNEMNCRHAIVDGTSICKK